MKKALIIALVLISAATVAGKVMSQSPSLDPTEFPGGDSHARDFGKVIQQVRNQLSQNIEKFSNGRPSGRDLELLKALDKYIAGDKILQIIAQLEEVINASPGTDEAKKAAAAIETLKTETNAPLFNPTQSNVRRPPQGYKASSDNPK